MANSLSDDERVSVKEEWNQIFVELFMELLKTYEADDKSLVRLKDLFNECGLRKSLSPYYKII